MRTLGKLIIFGAIVFADLQTLWPSIATRTATAEVQPPPEMRHIFEKGCYSCHSDERQLARFDEIVPGCWLVRHDVLTAQRHLDLSASGNATESMSFPVPDSGKISRMQPVLVSGRLSSSV
jgi:Haem-binding domain